VIIGLVSGTVAASHKNPALTGLVLLAVQELDLALEPTGRHLVAADSVGAGQGDLVLIANGPSTQTIDATANRPVDAVAVAIVDRIDLE